MVNDRVNGMVNHMVNGLMKFDTETGGYLSLGQITSVNNIVLCSVALAMFAASR